MLQKDIQKKDDKNTLNSIGSLTKSSKFPSAGILGTFIKVSYSFIITGVRLD